MIAAVRPALLLVLAFAAADAIDVDAQQHGCDGGDGAACAKLANAFTSGDGVAHKNLVRARSLFERGCDAKNGECCRHVAFALETGWASTPLDPEAALTTYVKACDLGDAESCAHAGSIEIKIDKDAAEKHVQRACDLGDPGGCEGYAALIAPHDAARAASLFVRACDAGLPSACASLGRLCHKADAIALSPLRDAPACARRAPESASAGSRARGRSKAGAFSVEIPSGLRLVDPEHDARLGRWRVAVGAVRGDFVLLVPANDRLTMPLAVVGDTGGIKKIDASDDATYKLFMAPRAGTVVAARAVDTALGRGCVYRFVRAGHDEQHAFLMSTEGDDTFGVRVYGNDDVAEATLTAILSSLRRE